MKELPATMKANLFSALAELARAFPYFSFSMVRKNLGDSPLSTKSALLREYLSEAMEKKVIHDAGRGWHSSLETPAALEHVPPLQGSMDPELKTQGDALGWYASHRWC